MCLLAVVTHVACECADVRSTDECLRWRDSYNGCDNYPEYMATVCSLTCGFCSQAPTTTPVTQTGELVAQSYCTMTQDIEHLCDLFTCDAIVPSRRGALCPRKCDACLPGTVLSSSTTTQSPTSTSIPRADGSKGDGGIQFSSLGILTIVIGSMVLLFVIVAVVLLVMYVHCKIEKKHCANEYIVPMSSEHRTRVLKFWDSGSSYDCCMLLISAVC